MSLVPKSLVEKRSTANGGLVKNNVPPFGHNTLPGTVSTTNSTSTLSGSAAKNLNNTSLSHHSYPRQPGQGNGSVHGVMSLHRLQRSGLIPNIPSNNNPNGGKMTLPQVVAQAPSNVVGSGGNVSSSNNNTRTLPIYTAAVIQDTSSENMTSPQTHRTSEPQIAHYATVRRQDAGSVCSGGAAGSVNVGGGFAKQSGQTNAFTLIAYQTQGAQTGNDAQKKQQTPTVLYAIPANQALQHQHAHQLHQHVIQTSTGPMIVHSAQLASLQRQQGIAAGLIGQPPGHAQGKIVGVVQTAALATPSTTSTPPPTACEGTLGQRPLSGGAAKASGRIGELVCTCPPELHQALAEQQQRQQNQQNALLLNRSNQLSDAAPLHPQPFSAQSEQKPYHGSFLGTDCAPCQAEREATLLSNGGKPGQTQPFAWGNRVISEGCTDTCLPCRNQNSDAESQVSYLVALFQALKASGVHADSFSSALCRLGITAGEKDDQRRLSTQLKSEIESIRSSLSEVKQKCYGLRNFISQETQAFERQLAVQLRKYDKKKGLRLVQPFFDARMQRVRSDRQALDNALAAYQTTWSSLIGQLADLEGVIEETGNDVLRGRCRITLPIVSALEERLHLAISAIEFCCENDPLLRKSVWQQAENEWNSAEYETRTLEEQLDQLSDLKERSSKLNGTISTLKRLAKVNANTRNSEQHLQRLRSLGGVLNPGAANSGSAERKRLLSTIKLLQPDHEERMRSIEIQDALRERRKRVFRDPPVIRAPAKALLLNGIHISPIWPDDSQTKRPAHNAILDHKIESGMTAAGVRTAPGCPRQRPKQTRPEDAIRHTPDDSFDSGDAGEPNTTANLPPPLRTPCILPANCVDQLPRDSSSSSSQATNIKSTPGLLKRSGMKSKGGMNVTFNTRVKVDDGSQEVLLNCILDDDQPEYFQEVKVIPRGGKSVETKQQGFRKCGEAGGDCSSPTEKTKSADEACWESGDEMHTAGVTDEENITASSPQKSHNKSLFSRLAAELPSHSELPPAPPPRLSSKLAASLSRKPDGDSVDGKHLLKYENIDSFLVTLDSQNSRMSSEQSSHPDNERTPTEYNHNLDFNRPSTGKI
nr:unnamed protein product [Spirometra erinaceieuropaei]